MHPMRSCLLRRLLKALPTALLFMIVLALQVNEVTREASAHTIYAYLAAQHSGKCITMQGTGNGVIAQQYSCSDTALNQRVKIYSAGSGWHYIRFQNSDRCLTVNAWVTYNNGTIDQWDCLNQDNQKWSGSFSNGVFQPHYSKHTYDAGIPKCITVNGESQAEGAIVNQYTCVGQANQSFLTAGQASAANSPYSAFGPFAYSSSSCSTWSDPITIVFTNAGDDLQYVPYWDAGIHAGWYVTGPLETDQYFKDYANGCSTDDYDVADSQGVCSDRYHMRWEYAFVTTTGYTFAATPHRDTNDGSCGHCIAPGGFTNAQFAIFNNWVGSGDHPNYSVAWWGNNQVRLGCNNQQVSASGYVYYISLDGETY